MAQPGWYQDPFGRFELRYFDGAVWTAHASLGGRQVIDPNGAGPSTPYVSVQPLSASFPPQRTTTLVTQHVGNGMAVAALVLGLVGLLAGLVPLFFFIALPCGVLAFIFGAAGRQKSIHRGATGKSMSVWGIVLGTIATVLGVVGLIAVKKAVHHVTESLDRLSTDTSVPAAVAADLSIESGFTPNPDRGVVSAGALISNNGARTTCGVEVQFTLVDSAGAPVDTDTETIPLIAAGQTVSIAPLQIGYQIADPAGLQVSVVGIGDTTDSTRLADCRGFYMQDGIEVDVQNPTLTHNDYSTAITGQLTNTSGQKVDTSYIDCVLRLGGKIVGGASSASTDPISPGGTVAFDIDYIAYVGEADEVICSAMG